MSIRERKLNLVESLLKLENEESISFLEAYLKVKHEPMTREELSKRDKFKSGDFGMEGY